MIYQLVQSVEGQMISSEFQGENVYPAMSARGFEHVGYLERNPRATIGPRAELIGQPKFSGVAGPMWNGMRDGVPVIRYEDREAYERLSA